MTSQETRRQARRVLLGPEFSVSFLLQGRPYENLRITNLSLGGCFAVAQAQEGPHFSRGMILENLVLGHPEHPKDPLRGAVSYVLGGGPKNESMDHVGIGIQFLELPQEASRSLDTWIHAALGGQSR